MFEQAIKHVVMATVDIIVDLANLSIQILKCFLKAHLDGNVALVEIWGVV